MQVAFLVGAIRTALKSSDDPATALGVLNRRLMGQSPGAATCLALCVVPPMATSHRPMPGICRLTSMDKPVTTEGALPQGIFACETEF